MDQFFRGKSWHLEDENILDPGRVGDWLQVEGDENSDTKKKRWNVRYLSLVDIVVSRCFIDSAVVSGCDISKQETFVDISITLWALAVHVVSLLVNSPGKVLIKVGKRKGIRCTVFELFKYVVVVALRKTFVRHSDSWW